MAFAGIAIGVGVLGIGMGAVEASGALSPSVSQPNTGLQAEQMAQMQAEQLPVMDLLNAQAQVGGTIVNPGYVEKNGQYYKKVDGFAVGNPVPASQATTTFKPTAEVQGEIANKLTAGQLANAQKYDSQFIAERLKEEQLANPQGAAARQALYNDVQQQVNSPQPVSPVATTMDNQIANRVAAGSGLTPEEQATLDAAVNGSSMTGSTGRQPDFSNALTTGTAGEERALQNAGSGATWLASGNTPGDFQYRQQQQGLTDLSSFISGQTPQSQFSQLSGAATGPTPNNSTNYLPGFNSGAAQQGIQAGIDQYGQNVNTALNQANGWTAGVSTALNAGNTLAKAGVL
jgi:hypothetical protein